MNEFQVCRRSTSSEGLRAEARGVKQTRLGVLVEGVEGEREGVEVERLRGFRTDTGAFFWGNEKR